MRIKIVLLAVMLSLLFTAGCGSTTEKTSAAPSPAADTNNAPVEPAAAVPAFSEVPAAAPAMPEEQQRALLMAHYDVVPVEEEK